MKTFELNEFNNMMCKLIGTMDPSYPIVIDYLENYHFTEQQRISFLLFLARDYRGTRYFFQHADIDKFPLCNQEIVKLVDSWDTAWAHVIINYKIRYVGSKSYLRSLEVIMS